MRRKRRKIHAPDYERCSLPEGMYVLEKDVVNPIYDGRKTTWPYARQFEKGTRFHLIPRGELSYRLERFKRLDDLAESTLAFQALLPHLKAVRPTTREQLYMKVSGRYDDVIVKIVEKGLVNMEDILKAIGR